MKCIFCEGEDVHECPGGTCDVRGYTTYSLGGTGTMNVYPGKVDARALQPPKYETRLSIEREEKAFFIELPVDLAVPYRNFIITGITQPKCDTCGSELPTRFEGGVMHIDAHDCKPRGGFEFL